MRLRTWPDEILKIPCKRVSLFDDKLRGVAQEMAKLMVASGGIGLAAPQVGISRRLMLCWDGTAATKLLVLINPELISSSGEQIGPEGCLSFPDQTHEIKRFDRVVMRYQDLKGKIQRIEASGLLSRCLQHELDHLNGIVFIERQERSEEKAEIHG